MEPETSEAADILNAEERRRWFRETILPLEPHLRLFGRRFARSGHIDLEDLVQETFARIIACETWREVDNPGAFAFSTLRNLALDIVRRSKVVSFEAIADIDQLDLQDDQPSPETYVVARDELRLLKGLIQTMPRQCRQVFTLRKVYDLSPKEIAERLRLSVSTVEKHLAKGVRICADMMSVEPAPPGETRVRPAWDARKNQRRRD